jgi:hypothetical protein
MSFPSSLRLLFSLIYLSSYQVVFSHLFLTKFFVSIFDFESLGDDAGTHTNGTFPPPSSSPRASLSTSLSMVEALQHQHNDSAVFYGRVQLPSISIAIVDSVKVPGPDFGSDIPHVT